MTDDTPVLGDNTAPPPPEERTAGAGARSGNFSRNLNAEPDDIIAKKMFLGGLLLLPWLHFVNIIHYRKQFSDATIDPKVTKWVRRSFLACFIMTIGFLSWTVLFQLKWKDFGWASLVMVIPPENLDEGW